MTEALRHRWLQGDDTIPSGPLADNQEAPDNAMDLLLSSMSTMHIPPVAPRGPPRQAVVQAEKVGKALKENEAAAMPYMDFRSYMTEEGPKSEDDPADSDYEPGPKRMVQKKPAARKKLQASIALQASVKRRKKAAGPGRMRKR